MKGFTLVETLVAIAIVVLAVTAPLYTANRGIVAAQSSVFQLTANTLAQQGVEYVRLMRDNEYLAAYQAGGATVSTAAWSAFTNNDPSTDPYSIKKCLAPNICTLDPQQTGTSVLSQCSGQSCAGQYLYLLPTGSYTQASNTGGTRTAYTRTIQAVLVGATAIKVTATVTWTYHGATYTITAVEHLTPWQ